MEQTNFSKTKVYSVQIPNLKCHKKGLALILKDLINYKFVLPVCIYRASRLFFSCGIGYLIFYMKIVTFNIFHAVVGNECQVKSIRKAIFTAIGYIDSHILI